VTHGDQNKAQQARNEPKDSSKEPDNTARGAPLQTDGRTSATFLADVFSRRSVGDHPSDPLRFLPFRSSDLPVAEERDEEDEHSKDERDDEQRVVCPAKRGVDPR
jgi:hypothetical protein